MHNHADTKSNHNLNLNPKPITKQHAIVFIQLHMYVFIQKKFAWDFVARLLQLFCHCTSAVQTVFLYSIKQSTCSLPPLLAKSSRPYNLRPSSHNFHSLCYNIQLNHNFVTRTLFLLRQLVTNSFCSCIITFESYFTRRDADIWEGGGDERSISVGRSGVRRSRSLRERFSVWQSSSVDSSLSTRPRSLHATRRPRRRLPWWNQAGHY